MATYESRRYNTPVPDASKIADGSVNNTEFEHLDGVTSDIQTQFNAKLNLSGGALTGALSTNNNISLGDNDHLYIGAGQDIDILSDGTTGFIKSNDLKLTSSTDEIYLDASVNGAVGLRHDNTQKLVTSASGVTVSGVVAATTVTGDGSALTSLNASNISSGTIASARLPGGLGKLLKSETATSTSTFTTTTQIPTDGTEPTSSEGIEVMTRSFTPTAASSTLIHTLNFYTGGQDGRSFTITSIFRSDGTRIGSSALCQGDNGHLTPQLLQGKESAGGTSQIDYAVRFGVGFNTSTVYWLQGSGTNGTPGGNIVDLITTWRIDEIGA
jgi:hypothetical protein